MKLEDAALLHLLLELAGGILELHVIIPSASTSAVRFAGGMWV